MMCFEEFKKLFCKDIFKTALTMTINKLQEQDRVSKYNAEKAGELK